MRKRGSGKGDVEEHGQDEKRLTNEVQEGGGWQMEKSKEKSKVEASGRKGWESETISVGRKGEKIMVKESTGAKSRRRQARRRVGLEEQRPEGK